MLYTYHQYWKSFADNLQSRAKNWTDFAVKYLPKDESSEFESPKLLNPFEPIRRYQEAGLELLNRLVRSYERPAFNLKETATTGLAIEEVIFWRKPFCQLTQFVRSDKSGKVIKGRAQILLVAPMSGHYATLLRETVKVLVDTHDVFITEWINARDVPLSDGDFGFDDFVSYVTEIIECIGEKMQRPIHVVAVCQPTVPVLASISLMSAAKNKYLPASFVLMGGPVDVRAAPTEVTQFADKHSLEWFRRNVVHSVPKPYAGVGREVYPGFVQHSAFISMNPARHFSSHVDFFNQIVRGDKQGEQAHRRFYDEYNAVADLPAKFYLDTIEKVFHQTEIATGNLVVNGVKVDPAVIKDSALLVIEGERDDISAPGQTAAALKLCKGLPENLKENYSVANAGHYGIFSGSIWREKVAPRMKAFVDSQNDRALGRK